MKVKDLIYELKNRNQNAYVNIFVPYTWGEDSHKDIWSDNLRVVEQDDKSIEIYSDDDLQEIKKNNCEINWDTYK